MGDGLTKAGLKARRGSDKCGGLRVAPVVKYITGRGTTTGVLKKSSESSSNITKEEGRQGTEI